MMRAKLSAWAVGKIDLGCQHRPQPPVPGSTVLPAIKKYRP